ncbi:MAG: sulfatase [Planctomycetota bacterium]
MIPKRERLIGAGTLWLILGIASALMLGHAEEAVADDAARPNILFCMADDWGWPHAGAYGDEVVRTPVFDRIAQEGVLFEKAFAPAPSCSPCRSAVITGQHFYRLGPAANLWGALPASEPNFLFLLRESGYEIGHYSKSWGPGSYEDGGYTEPPCGPGMPFKAFLDNRDPKKPFCFWYGSGLPHRPYKPGQGAKSGIDPAAVAVPDFLPDNEVVRNDIADYYHFVERWDRLVGNAVKMLKKRGEFENTVIVVTGDHGMPFPRSKTNLYDYGVRVPLAVRWGRRIKPGRKVTDFVSLTDFAPTLLELGGVDAPEAMTAESLVPILADPGSGRIDPARDSVVCGRERHTVSQGFPSIAGYPSRSIRTDRWLLILNLAPDRWPAGVPEGSTHPRGRHSDCDGPSKLFMVDHRDAAAVGRYYDLCYAKRPAVELYDCDADPYQIKSLADEPGHAEIAAALRARLTSYLARTGDPRFTDADVLFDAYPCDAPPYMKKVNAAIAAFRDSQGE